MPPSLFARADEVIEQLFVVAAHESAYGPLRPLARLPGLWLSGLNLTSFTRIEIDANDPEADSSPWLTLSKVLPH
jgi:hypothetical protein